MKLTKIILGFTMILSLTHCTTSKEGLSYLALGDSYTIGESVVTNSNFPYQLADSIWNEGEEYTSPVIIARTGWRTDQLMEAIESANLKKEYDLVTLLIGVNNEFQGRSLEEYERDFISLCQKSIELAGNKKERVFVLSIPDYGYTPYGKTNMNRISSRIDLFNASNKRIADSLQLNYIDITRISRQGLSDPDLVADDGLHPSAKMYGLWVQEIRRKMQMKAQD
ncbi:SGNH/GDSL hydrolase family protein [Fluviicola taffensis]|uniref:SGNH/GDSL hydrolase family protein n=1 Tax=Fluviicola taffensis TaxID=191579 RepID=UPI003137B817